MVRRSIARPRSGWISLESWVGVRKRSPLPAAKTTARRTGPCSGGVTRNSLSLFDACNTRDVSIPDSPSVPEGEGRPWNGSVDRLNLHGPCPPGQAGPDEQHGSRRGPGDHSELADDREGEPGLVRQSDQGGEPGRADLVHAEAQGHDLEDHGDQAIRGFEEKGVEQGGT